MSKENKDLTDNDAKPILPDVRYQFWYKDSSSRIDSIIIKVKEKDSELAIATFESLYPNIYWRSFKHIT